MPYSCKSQELTGLVVSREPPAGFGPTEGFIGLLSSQGVSPDIFMKLEVKSHVQIVF
jgi:hypothetical protein